MSDVNLDNVRAFVRLSRLKKETEETAKKLGKQIIKLGEGIELQLALAGLRNLPITVDGKESTVYLWSQDQPVMREGVDREKITAALKEHGVDIVQEGYNANSFAAYVREQFEMDTGGLADIPNGLPPWLSELVELKTVSRPRMRS